MGNIGILGVKLFTFWRERSEIEYVGYKGYKVIGSDPNDQVIYDLASLKNCIAKYLVELELDKQNALATTKTSFKKYTHIFDMKTSRQLVQDLNEVIYLRQYVGMLNREVIEEEDD